jgi:lysyl-tRNA synthetase class 2
VLVAFLKGKIWMGWIGFFLPVIAWVGALRLARPRSPWARWFYRKSEHKMERAARRDESFSRNVGHWRLKFSDLVSGAPDRPSHKKRAEGTTAPASAKVVPPVVPRKPAPGDGV